MLLLSSIQLIAILKESSKIFPTNLYFGFLSDFDLNFILSQMEPEDKEYASKQIEGPDREMKMISRFFVRTVVQRTISTRSKIEFLYTRNGRPFVKGLPFSFNLAHSGDCFVIGISSFKIGVDVESLTRTLKADKLSEFLFSEDEYVEFLKIPSALKQEAFINAWTRKEATIKAFSGNMNFPMSQLEVSFYPDEAPCLKSTKWSLYEKENWILHSFNLPNKYKCAVAVESKNSRIKVVPLKEFISHELKSTNQYYLI